MEAKITIAVPYFSRNKETGELYLRKAIESVLSQTESQWKLIVVDDKSPIEGTESFVQSFGDRRISYYRNTENMGQSGNWNRCIDLIDTDIFAILHADDEMKPNYIVRMLDAWESEGDAAALFCEADIINEQGEVIFSFADYVKKFLKPNAKHTLAGEEGLIALLRGNYIMCPTVCYRKPAIGNLRFKEGLWKYIPDFYFWTLLLLNEKKMTGLPDSLFKYRRHTESGTEIVRQTNAIFDEESEFYNYIASAAGKKQWKKAEAVARSKRMVKLRTAYFGLKDLASLRVGAAAAKFKWLLSNGVF